MIKMYINFFRNNKEIFHKALDGCFFNESYGYCSTITNKLRKQLQPSFNTTWLSMVEIFEDQTGIRIKRSNTGLATFYNFLKKLSSFSNSNVLDVE